MFDIDDTTKQLGGRVDLAAFFGLGRGARNRDIRAAMERAARFEVSVEIEEDPVMQFRTEVWEVRILRALPQCRVMARCGSRGKWTQAVSDVPAEVMLRMAAREARDGSILTSRSWKSWEKMNWMEPGDRRLRSRSGEIRVLMDFARVGYPTGEVSCALILSPLGAPDPELVSPVRLQMPVQVRRVAAAIQSIRIASEAQMV